MNRSTMPKSTDQPRKEKSDKARAILAGALQVFISHGYGAASMDRLAAAAGVSKPTLYSYFKNKEGLFIALVQQLTQKNRQMLFSLPMGPDLQNPPDKVLRQMANSVLEEASRNQTLLTIMRLIIGESERFPELARTFISEIQKPLFEQLSRYFASQTQLQLPDPEVAARIFAGSLVHYLIIQKVLHGDDIVPLECDRMVNGLIHLITATADKSS